MNGFVRLMQFGTLLLYPLSFVVIAIQPGIAGWFGREFIEFLYAPILGLLRFFGAI
jgi:hypothetical protein